MGRDQVLEGRRLVLRGPDGEVQVELEATAEGPLLALSYDGQRCVEIVSEKDFEGDVATRVSVIGPDGREPIAGLWSRAGRSWLFVDAHDAEGVVAPGVAITADPEDQVPRMVFTGRDHWLSPVLELPAPTREGGIAAARARIVDALKDVREAGADVRELAEQAVWEVEGFRYPRPDDVEP